MPNLGNLYKFFFKIFSILKDKKEDNNNGDLGD